MKRSLYGCLLVLLVLAAMPAMGQDAISAKAGLVNYFEGTVLLNGEALTYSLTKFHQIPNGGTLETPANGRAEVLLTPGVMLWLGEGSRMELVSDQIDAAQLRLLGGSAVVSSTEFPKDASVTIFIDDHQVTFNKSGVYNLSASPAKLEVHEGQAEVLRAGVETRVKKGRAMLLDEPGSALASLDKNATPDPLTLWAETRDNYLTVANVSAARQVQTAGGFSRLGGLGMLGAYNGFGGWVFNPFFGMYTFVPFGAGFASPFGHYFWGPQTVRAMYTPFLFGGGGFGSGNPGRGAMARNSISRSGFSNNAAYGNSSYARGGSSTGDVFANSPRGRGGIGGAEMGGYSRGESGFGGDYGGRSGGAGYGRGGGGYSSGGGYSGGGGGGASAPSTSAGGASVGRGGGGASSGGGRGN